MKNDLTPGQLIVVLVMVALVILVIGIGVLSGGRIGL